MAEDRKRPTPNVEVGTLKTENLKSEVGNAEWSEWDERHGR